MAADDDAVLEALDELYRTPPEGFVARRTELAKERTTAGDKAGAKELKAAKRPTVAAWAINQLRDSVPDLVDEACELAETGRAVLTGEQAGDARALASQRRTLVAALLKEARGVLAGAGLEVSSATERQVVETLDAALVSPDVAELVAVGRLLAATTATGFEGLIAVDNPFAVQEDSSDTPRPKLTVLKGGKASGPKKPTSAAGPDDEDEDDAEEAERAQALLEQRAAETAAAAEKANARLAEVQEEAEEATEQLEAAQERAAAAARALTEAESEAKRAEQHLNEVTERLEAAEEDAEAADDAARKAATRT